MQISDFSQLDKNFKYSLSIGTFDGLHLGHIKTLNRLKQVSNGTKTLVIAFISPPRSYINHKNQDLLTTKSEKVFLLGNINNDYYMLINFNSTIKSMNQKEFLNYIGVDIENLVVGKNFRFGKGRQDVSNLNLNVEMCDYEVVDNEIVSSSLIRNLISDGHVGRANRMMGRNYYIEAKLKHINGVEKFITEEHKLLPPRGVYSFSVFENDRVGQLRIEDNKIISLDKEYFDFLDNGLIKISLIGEGR